MHAADYAAWYQTPRGRWIGAREVELVLRCLQRQSGESVLDVGAGTGYFTTAVAASRSQDDTALVAGVDIDPACIDYARQQNRHSSPVYLLADAHSLPFADASFDLVIAITALCCMERQEQVLAEMLRVTRTRVVLGLLNRHSLLWWQKGRNGGCGGYAGAHWHTAAEVRRLFHGMPVENLKIQTAIQLPSGSRLARMLEPVVPKCLGSGGFMLVTAQPLCSKHA